MEATATDGDVRRVLQRRWEELTESQRRLGRLVLDHPGEVVFYGVRELAERAETSTATVVRFAQKLGYDGYNDLLAAIQRQLLPALSPAHRLSATLDELARVDGEDGVLDHALQRDVHSLEETRRLTGAGEFNVAVDLIQGARIVYLAGLGLSAAPVTTLAFRLRRVGLPAVVATGAGADLYNAMLPLRHDDLLVAFGFQPVPAELTRVAAWAAERAVPVLAITDTQSSDLQPHATVTLHAKRGPLTHLTSVVAPLAVANALAVAVAERRRDEAATAYAAYERLSQAPNK